MFKVLAIDDDQAVLNYLEVFLIQSGEFIVECLNDSRKAIETISHFKPDLVLLDMEMPYFSGLDILLALSEHADRPEVLVLSGAKNVKLAIQATKLGACDYLTKPVDEAKLLASIKKPFKIRDLKTEIRTIENGKADSSFESIATCSSEMRKTLNYVKKIAVTDNPVLIWGESGTGKELIAKGIHTSSKRKNAPFISINASEFASELFASEFLGLNEEAFSGAVTNSAGLLEKANGGTLFLDEIGDLSPHFQVKMLRVFQDGEYYQVGSANRQKVDIRLITATNKDLQKEIQKGEFRTDLFYRLNVCSVYVIPLYKRAGDIPNLARYFVNKYSKIHERKISDISEDVLNLLNRYRYPGNIRELGSIINTAVVMVNGRQLTRRSLPEYFLEATSNSRYRFNNTHNKSIAQVEKEHIERILDHTKGNRSAAAGILEISRVSLISKIKKYEINI